MKTLQTASSKITQAQRRLLGKVATAGQWTPNGYIACDVYKPQANRGEPKSAQILIEMGLLTKVADPFGWSVKLTEAGKREVQA